MNMDMRSFFLNYEVALFISNETCTRAGSLGNGHTCQCIPGIKKANIAVEFLKALRAFWRRFCEKGK